MTRQAVLALTLITLAPLGVRADTDGARAVKRATMAQLFSSMRVLLPLSADPDAFAAAGDNDEVKTAIDGLAIGASVLRDHTQRDDPGERFLGDRVAKIARRIHLQYQRGRHRQAAATLHELTRYCVACHARTPSESSLMSQGFVEASRLRSLPPVQRARLHLATRGFDDALSAFEEAFLDEKVHVAKLLPSVTDYLVTAVRVRKDLKRPRASLAKLKARADVWARLSARIDAWDDALGRFAKYPPAATLEGAEKLLRQAAVAERWPKDGDGLVHRIVAAGVLNRLIDSGRLRGAKLARAYLALAEAESRIETNYWLDGAQDLLESCVRLVPHSASAMRCYALLEDEVVRAWAGESGVGVPPAVRRQLDELEAIALPKE